MEETVEVQDRIALALSKKETLRRARDRVHDYGNQLLQYSIKWKDLDDQFDSIAEDLSERFRIVEARENAVAEQIRVVERQETELRSIQLMVDRNSRAKEEKLEFLESRLDFYKREVVEKEKKLESCEMKCRNKEKELVSLCEAVDERSLKIKEKEKELWSVQQMLEDSERDFRREDEKLGFLMCTIDFCDQEISKKEEQLGLMEEKLHKYEMDCRRKEEEELMISLSVAAEKYDPEIKEKKKEVQLLQNSVTVLHGTFVSKKKEMEAGFDFDFSSKMKELDSLQVKIDGRSKVLSLLEKSVADHSKRLDSKRIQLDLMTKRTAEFSVRERQSQEQHLEKLRQQNERLYSLQVKIDAHSHELSSLENSVADCSKRLDSKRIELDLITKRAAEFSEREKQSQQQQLKELRQKATIPVGFPSPQNVSYPTDNAISYDGTQVKIEQPDFPTHQQIYTAATNYQFPISDNQIQSQMIRGELAHLNIDIDLAKLTLDEINASYGQQLSREENGFDVEAMKTHIKLLEQITASSSTPIMPQVKQEAINLAAKWVWKLRTRTSVDCMEVLGFFNLLAAYKLGSLFSQGEILRYIQMYSLRDKAPQLCHDILHSGYVISSPKDLLQQKGNKKRSSSSGLLGEQDTQKESSPSLKKSL